MLELRKIGVTGGIASGKTTVCLLLEKHGAYRLSADDIIHQLLETDTQSMRRVVSILGSAVLVDGRIDRKEVASRVFSNPEKLEQLESVLHPPLFAEIQKRYQRVKQNKDYSCFVVEMPLVQEIKKEKEFDLILAVISDEERAKSRFIAAGFSSDDYQRRMKRHWDIKRKAREAHVVLSNNGDLHHLEKQVKTFIYTLTEE